MQTKPIDIISGNQTQAACVEEHGTRHTLKLLASHRFCVDKPNRSTRQD